MREGEEMPPASIREELRAHLVEVERLHRLDLAEGFWEGPSAGCACEQVPAIR